MSISTHKMLADADIENKAQIADQASTLSANTKHFFDCSETSPVTTVTDIVNSLTMTNGGSFIVADGSVDGVNVSIGVPNEAPLSSGVWTDPETSDYLIMCCARSVDAGLDVNDNGAIEFMQGSSNNGYMKLQPYYVVWVGENALPITETSVATPFSNNDMWRITGEDYMYIGLKRGDWMEHYSNGVLTGRVNVAEHYSGVLAAEWRNQVLRGSAIRCGHSAYGSIHSCDQDNIDVNVCTIIGEQVPGVFDIAPPNTAGSVLEKEQDYYGLLAHFFPNGAPSQSEIENGMNWMKEQWLLGNKVIYPGWIF